MMTPRNFWCSLVLLGVFPLVTRGWMDVDQSRSLYSDVGRLHQEDSRRFEVTRRKDIKCAGCCWDGIDVCAGSLHCPGQPCMFCSTDGSCA